jgi:hypothetical protein
VLCRKALDNEACLRVDGVGVGGRVVMSIGMYRSKLHAVASHMKYLQLAVQVSRPNQACRKATQADYFGSV